MKIVINRCFGGFGLSMRAIKRIAELQGRKCHFFRYDHKTRKYVPINKDSEACCVFAFDIPNPNEVIGKDDSQYGKHDMDQFRDYENRGNPYLVQAVEELGNEANGRCASLSVVEIPDGVEWEIDDYDGVESIHEKHRSWR